MTAAPPVEGPLAGVRVVALEQSVAGPLCSRILADLGADVVKWERAGVGDFARHWDDHVHGESGQFWWLNRGKSSVAVDLRDDDQKQSFFAALDDADVLVHNMSPAAAARLGLDESGLSGRFPRLVSCQISGYGADSPYADRKAYDMLVQAESGIMSLTGTPDTPTRVGVSMCDVSTGLYAAVLVVAAVHEQRATGRGRCVDLAMHDVAVEFLGPMLTSYVNEDVSYARVPQHHHGIAPYGVFRCADGEVVVAVEQDAEWVHFCATVLRRPELAEAPEYATNLQRIARRDEVNALVDAALVDRPVDEVVALLGAEGFAFGRLNDVAAVAEHPVVAARGVLDLTRTADGTAVRALRGLAARVFGVRPTRDRPPLLGEDQHLMGAAPRGAPGEGTS